MKKEPTEAEIRQLAAQLRNPQGKEGIEIAHLMNKGNGPMNLHTLAVVNPQPHDCILEIGMGNGFFVKNILNQDPSIQYAGCDISASMVAEAIKINQKFADKFRAKFNQCKGNDLPYINAFFNKVFTINTLYFWDEAEVFLSEIKRVLKPQGQFILSIRPKHLMEYYPVSQYGFNLFTEEEVINLLQQAGFTSFEVTRIKEPPQEIWGNQVPRESLIIACKEA